MATDPTRRLHHHVPAWVAPGFPFHVRLRIERPFEHSLTSNPLSQVLLDSAAFYHAQRRWYCHILLLMPDHLHALLSFPLDAKMTAVVGRWKAWQTRTLGVGWQENFFDHRIRDTREFESKAHYIRQNPVVRGLCASPADWPYIIDANSLNRP